MLTPAPAYRKSWESTHCSNCSHAWRTQLPVATYLIERRFCAINNDSQMRHGQSHLVSTLLLPLFVLLSLSTPGRLVYCIGSDGHEGIELAGVPCQSQSTPSTDLLDIWGDVPTLDVSSCVDVPIPATTHAQVIQRTDSDLGLSAKVFASVEFAFSAFPTVVGVMPTTPTSQLPLALPQASLRTIILLV